MSSTLRMIFLLLTILAATMASASLFAKDEGPAQVTHDGLQLVPDSKVAVVWTDPEANFSGYDKFLILDCHVAFKKNWQRDHRRVSNKDMEKIKKETAELFRASFVEVLQEKGGYTVVDEPAEDVLVIRPAIVDLDVNAPDTMSSGRSMTFTSSAGSATLFIELYDSVSGDLLARAVDAKQAREWATMRWTTSVSNSTEAKRIMKGWANALREGMDEAKMSQGEAG